MSFLTFLARCRAHRNPGRSRLLLMEPLEARVHLSAAVESIDGSGNNTANPAWGSAGADLLRLAAAAYADGVSSPALPSDASARAISNILNDQSDPSDPSQDLNTVDGNFLSDFGYAFGQFMDHDMDLTPDTTTPLDIPVAAGDPIGPAPLPFDRSQTDPTTGTGASNPAQQVNAVTSYFDLSQVYGSSQVVADALRTFQGGLLKTSPGNMLPYDNTTYFTTDQIAALNMANDAQAVPESQLFAAGDVRANENVELTALETLFVRNHNAIAEQLQKEHPGWTDEQLYQEARKLNIFDYQNIIYNEWIPAVLGPKALTAYKGYQSNVDASIANEFSTVAFRFGHSLLSPDIERSTNQGTGISDVSPDGPDIPLAEDFFDPDILTSTGAVDPLTGHTSSDIGAILKADADGVSQASDLMAIGDVRNLLFNEVEPGVGGGQDLMALDVQRGRDNGIPDYNSLRVAMGLPAVTSFAQISSNPTIQQELAQAYPGGVNTIDAFEGGLAEDHVAGSDVGPLFQAIMVNQFERLRDGDRFFYLNESFTPQEKKILSEGNTLTKVIEASTNITNLQPDAFVFKASISGTVNGSTPVLRGMRGPVGLAGITVQLTDADGDVLATTTTDARGRYSFNQQDGLDATGVYSVSLVLTSAIHPTRAVSASTVLISRGGAGATANFDVPVPPTPPKPPVVKPRPGASGVGVFDLPGAVRFVL